MLENAADKRTREAFSLRSAWSLLAEETCSGRPCNLRTLAGRQGSLVPVAAGAWSRTKSPCFVRRLLSPAPTAPQHRSTAAPRRPQQRPPHPSTTKPGQGACCPGFIPDSTLKLHRRDGSKADSPCKTSRLPCLPCPIQPQSTIPTAHLPIYRSRQETDWRWVKEAGSRCKRRSNNAKLSAAACPRDDVGHD